MPWYSAHSPNPIAELSRPVPPRLTPPDEVAFCLRRDVPALLRATGASELASQIDRVGPAAARALQQSRRN